MILAIIQKEARALLRDGRLWGLALAVSLLVVVMLGVSSQRREQAERERHEVETVSRDQWDHQGDKNPHRAAHFGLYAFKPRSALSSVDPGIDAQTGQALWLEPHKRNMALFSPAADEAPSLGLGAFTPAFVLLGLVPLLILVLGHHSISQEREDGTLRMLHACGMRGVPLVMGKWLGLWLGMTVALWPALLLGAWWLVDDGGGARAAVLGLCLLVYYGIWAALTVLVSVHSRTSRGALLALIAIWVAATFLVPRLGASVVEQLDPLPDVDHFWRAVHEDIERGLPGDGNAQQRLRAFDAQLLQDNKVDRLEDLPFGANAKRRLFRDAYATRVHALHFDRLWEAQLAQQRQRRLWALLSPVAPMRGITSAIAGTDLAHRRHFEESAERYRQQFTARMDEWDLQATRGVTSFESRYAGDAQWQSMPAWSYEPPGLKDALGGARADLALLIGWLALAVAALLASARKLNP